LSKATNILR
jgi:hypothetical protein